MHSILVEDYMDTNPHAISDKATVREAVSLFMRERIPGAPVINDEKTLIGFISEQDCIKEMLNDVFYCEESPAVTAVMSRNVRTVSPNASILEIAEAMSKAPPKNYPVVNEGKLVGLLSRKHILTALVETNEDCYIHH
ncbi:CBS domain-containing protein [Teredinibacter purpureus]|uniref:CBS domain-containing protein n=1 Tax=Teredinibacter purpureus TaxID=2731756 RepID=UPI0005F8448C|nr:CBS domain-containing protein [Teredinibacter purpureus]